MTFQKKNKMISGVGCNRDNNLFRWWRNISTWFLILMGTKCPVMIIYPFVKRFNEGNDDVWISPAMINSLFWFAIEIGNKGNRKSSLAAVDLELQ